MKLIEYKDIEELDRLISDEELATLSCPLMKEQQQKWERISNVVTPESLSRLLARIQHELIDYKCHDQSQGIINLVYFLNTTDLSTGQPSRFVLKLLNPDERFKEAKTYESGIINYLREQVGDRIPLPKIFDCSYEPEESVLGCGYILMERVDGETIEDVTSGDMSLIPQSLVDQLVEIVKTLKSVKPIEGNMIGSFGKDAQIVPLYPAKAPCKTFLEFLLALMDLGIAEVNKISSLRFLSPVLEDKKREIIERVESSSTDLKGLNFDDQVQISHMDLNQSNVIIDPDSWQVKAVIDWEWAMQMPDMFSFFDILNFNFDTLSDMTPAQLETFNNIYSKVEENGNVKHSLLRRFLWSYACGVAFCTSYDYMGMMQNPENYEHGANIHAKRIIVKRTNRLIKNINGWEKVMRECFV